MEEFFRFSASSKSKIYAPKILNREDYFVKCIECGSVHLKKEIRNIDLLVEGKGKYPDILLCGHWPVLIVSDKVLKKWKENNISGFHNYSVRLFRSNGEEIPTDQAFYHHIIITGRSELNLEMMGVQIISKCGECETVKFNKGTWEFGTPIMKQNSWDGSDLFSFNYFHSSPLCGMKSLELIQNNKLTNFSVTRMEDMFDYVAAEVDLKSYSKPRTV